MSSEVRVLKLVCPKKVMFEDRWGNQRLITFKSIVTITEDSYRSDRPTEMAVWLNGSFCGWAITEDL